MPRKTLKHRKSRRRTAKKRGGARRYFKRFYYETDVEGNKITPENYLGEIAPTGEHWTNLDHIEHADRPEGEDD